MNGRKGSESFVQHHSSLLYTRLEGGEQLNRVSSAHESAAEEHLLSLSAKHHLTLDGRQPRKVGFKSISSDKRSSGSCKKLKLLMATRAPLPRKKEKAVVTMKTFKSLDSSFLCIVNNVDYNHSRRTLRPSHPHLEQCRQAA
jgi:hypothetical protein